MLRARCWVRGGLQRRAPWRFGLRHRLFARPMRGNREFRQLRVKTAISASVWVNTRLSFSHLREVLVLRTHALDELRFLRRN